MSVPVTPGNTTVALVVLVLAACVLAAAALWRLVRIRRRLQKLHLRLLETEARLTAHAHESDTKPSRPHRPTGGSL